MSGPQMLGMSTLTQLLLIEREHLYLLNTPLAVRHQLYPCVGRESNEPILVAFRASVHPRGSESR